MSKRAKTIDITKIRAHLLDRLRHISEHLRIDVGELKESMRGGDPCDAAFSTTETELASRLAEHGSKEAAQIQYALHQLDHGRYGVCENCNNSIPTGRLEALPYSILCLPCQKLAEDGDICEEDLRRRWGRLMRGLPSTDEIEVMPDRLPTIER